jgi:phage repressor protein C with HTH and peptisase S24 domain
MSKLLRGDRGISAAEADRIRRFFGFIPPEEIDPSIAVIGRVGAGDHVQLFDDFEKGNGIMHIQRPTWIPSSEIAAAEISGSSAEPWALDGDIIFWRRHTLGVLTEDLGRPVIAETEDGMVMLKRLGMGSEKGLWNLLSINPSHPNLFDIRLKWASRVLPPLPREDVREI